MVDSVETRQSTSAKVAELADAPDLGSGTERCGGSSPPFRTKRIYACRNYSLDLSRAAQVLLYSFIDSPAYVEYASATHEVLSARLLAGLT